MNITDDITELLPSPYKEEVQNNKEIQFYIYDEGYCFRDLRFECSKYEHDNFECTREDLVEYFKDHIDSIKNQTNEHNTI